MRYFSSLILTLSLTLTLFAQDPYADSAEVTVNKFFHSLNTGDTTGLRTLFGKDARIQTVFVNKESKTILHEENLNELIKAMGEPRKDKWDERITKTEIILDYPLAIVNMFYSFYLNDKLSHCGVNVFQVIHNNGKWEIISLIDTRRKDKCK